MFKIKKNNIKHIYIHIGFMKTGTSAIQSFINANKEFLENEGFYFPKVNLEAMNYLGFSLLDEIPPRIHQKKTIKREELYKNLKTEINNSKFNKIILTTEAYSLMSTNLFLGDKAPEMLSKLLNEDNFRLKIIAFIRRQDEYLESQYNQHVKTHDFWKLYTKDITSFYEEKKDLLNFNTIINSWAKYFGEKNILLNVYDKKNDIIADFLDLLNIATKPNKESKKILINKKLNFKALEFMRLANNFEIKKDTAAENYKLLELIENALGNDNEYYQLLNTEQAKGIMEEHLTENKILANKYLNNNITWCLPNENYNINNKLKKLTKEDCIQVATEIWNHFQIKKK